MLIKRVRFVFFTDSIRHHFSVVRGLDHIQLRFPENVHLLHVRKCGPFPILVFTLLQKDIHRKTKNQLDVKNLTKMYFAR